MALPADGSPMLEGHPDNGKDHGKVWSNEAEEDEVGNAGTAGSSCSSSASSSGNSTTSSSDDEADNEDQDDFKSRLCFVKVLVGKLHLSLKHHNSTVDQRGAAKSSTTVDLAGAASQLLEILPQNFKYKQDIGVAQKPQEDKAPCTSLEFASGLDKQEEPILRPENPRPIGTSQHHQVGLEEGRASLTSGRTRSTTQKVDDVKEDDPPSKPSFGTALPSSFEVTSELDKPEEPILRPEDSISISASPQPLAGWRNLVASCTSGRARRTTKKVDDVKEDDPPSKPSDQVGLKEDVAHATSVTGINGKRTKDSDAEEQPPAKRSKDTLAEKELTAKKTRNSVAEVKLPAKRTRNSDDAEQEPSAKRIRENQTEDVLPSKKTRDSVAEEKPPAKRTRDTVAEEELPANTTKYSDDPEWDEIVQRIGRRMAWRYGKEWENQPIPSTPLFIPYRKTDHEDPVL
ncbi:nucleolar protein dao-5-like [Xiphophorus couchianus]|uniref:nucleolar protein dao-5-like n=1 Tax=Xiphophorus couchianus TaxID=32473 RepID=UPI001016C67C|nr:nucleolar protein dao-5-like [Xiphophorus couchianus]XP_027884949.1 nucleolar protein dao-5-like [Xiphophorus couchianus]XP_027884950.1 nucleolar protein dao-5-like [Xiphophorus couchianus]